MNSYAVKMMVRQRDGFACTSCGMTNDEHEERYGRMLDVHRTEPGSVYTIDGCVTVCKECHKALPKRKSGQRDLGNLHANGYLVRLPIEFRSVLEELARKNSRTMTVELQLAVIAHLKRLGVPCPDAPVMGRKAAKKDELRTYYVDAFGGWFVIRCPSMRVARRVANAEYGRSSVKEVRLATEDDVRSYRVQHGGEPSVEWE